MIDSVAQRWDAFLGKIKTTSEELLDEGCRGCVELGTSNSGTTAMSNAWQGLRAETFALVDKIDSTWSEKVLQTFEAAGACDKELLKFEDRGRQLGRHLRYQLERKEIETFGEVGVYLLKRAQESLGKQFLCTQCGAALKIPEQIFRSQYVTCEYCTAVNTFEPGMDARMVENYCSHHLSRLAAIVEWDALQSAEQQYRDSRSKNQDVRFAVEKATRNYWQTYYSARARLVPDFEKDIERDVLSRVEALSQR